MSDEEKARDPVDWTRAQRLAWARKVLIAEGRAARTTRAAAPHLVGLELDEDVVDGLVRRAVEKEVARRVEKLFNQGWVMRSIRDRIRTKVDTYLEESVWKDAVDVGEARESLRTHFAWATAMWLTGRSGWVAQQLRRAVSGKSGRSRELPENERIEPVSKES